ncbi:SusD/RagB family nutrient-binding outer membrane lipoprotein [Zunongwangia sp. HGR-M22]|uniref:SusD/RagB family nutrient-binding outer membrane lipoprotein n=1 Tax=Zunongwangia sp. HGR-M22 TaxID=3015168 RepID=UPI0022DE0E9E|nr:SusD/RagB family nutrient-binding outer membrane lipoprotein [Zunongwangia sp. HGR-M22]WBL25699.1 SusD/RagB family nutrient-binding outer membrane lipoprotein [Zunongwangia sp. HGR-M22]
MKKIYNYIILVSLVSFSFSCSDDYFDVNSSETQPTNTGLAPQYRIEGAIENTVATAQYRGVREVLGVVQYGSQNTAAYYSESWNTFLTTGSYFLWQNVYVYALPNTADLIFLGEEYNSPHYTAVGKILRAYLFGMATDQYGAIVTDDSYDPGQTIQLEPEFVSQEEVYEEIFLLLDEALAELDMESELGLDDEDGDILYHGDLEQWKRFANSTKARYLNHLSKKSSGEHAYDPQAIISAAENGFNSNEDNALIQYGGGEASNDNQPFSESGYGSTRFDYFSEFFVELLKNPLNISSDFQDPRLSVIVPEAINGGYQGVPTGAGVDNEDEEGDNYSVGNGGFYTSPDSPTYMMTYSEVKFIEAEARFRSGDVAGAYTAYKTGVEADLQKLNISAEEISNYLTKIDTEIGQTEFDLSQIFVQKYIANMLNPETWVDFRRVDYSSDIYPGLERPENVNVSIFPNEDDWIRAMMYEYNEEDRNYENMPNNDPSVRLTTPVWWDIEE